MLGILVIVLAFGLLAMMMARHHRGGGPGELVWELPVADHDMPPEWDAGSSSFKGKDFARAARSFAAGTTLYPREPLFPQAAAISFSAAGAPDSALAYLDRSEKLTYFPNRLQPIRRHILLEAGFADADGSDPADAVRLAARVLRSWPHDSDGLMLQGYGEARLGHAESAEDILSRLLKAHPRQFPAYKTMVELCLRRGDAASARAWVDRMARLDPQATGLDALRQMVDAGTSSGPQVFSDRLRVSCQSGCAPDAPQKVLDVAEQAWSYLSGQLGFQPARQISVLLTPDGAPGLPGWADAVFDGQVRVPLNHLDQNLPEVLRHELTHAFLAEASRGRVPVWYNEGMAQLMQGQQLLSLPDAAGMEWLDSLPQRRSFTDLSEDRARLAYRYSLRLATELWMSGGSQGVRDYMGALAADEDDSAAFSEAFGTDYAVLSARIRAAR